MFFCDNKDVFRQLDMKLSRWIAITALTVLFFHSNDAKRCTQVLSRDDIQEVIWKEPCVKKYEERCSFFSLSYCVFYHQMFCEQRKNATVKTYYIRSECCEGYYLADNGTCIGKKPGVSYVVVEGTQSPEDPNYVEEPLKELKKPVPVEVKISGGGYAGIVCGLVLVICIVGFIIIAVRKRKRRKGSRPDSTLKVLYHDPSNGVPSRASSVVSRTPSNTQQRATTPSSSKSVSPPRSPVKHSLPADIRSSPTSPGGASTPILSNNRAGDDIPESDV